MKSRIGAGVAGLSLALLISACGNAPIPREDTATGSLPTAFKLEQGFDKNAHFRWATIAFPASWDPVKSLSGGDLPVFRPVYDRLFDLDQKAQLQPMLATDWTVADDNLSVTLSLREGLTFADGTPFDAEAVKFNLERNAAKGSLLAAESAAFASAEVIDSKTIKINVSGGLGAYLTALGVRSGIIVSPTAAQSGALDQGPVGIGSYTLTEFVPGERAEFAKSVGYWDSGAQNVATMTYRVMIDDQTRYNALQSGELDGIYLQPGQVDQAVAKGYKVVASEANNFLYLAVNAAKAPFDDEKARLAIQYALDREKISQGLFDGHCTPSIQAVPRTSVGYSDKVGDGLQTYPHDPKKAKALLAEAGATAGVEISLLAPNITMFTQLAEVVQAQLAEVGIAASVKPVPSAQLRQEFAVDQTVEAAALPYVGTPDPNGAMAYFMPGHPFNIGQAASQETIDLAKQAAGPVDPAERKPLYEKVAQSMLDHQTQIVPICLLHLASAYGTNVSNVEQPSYDAPTQRGVAIKD
ncbi:ABC transporter substrate-binding protein [Cumulibacter manganitolerans]|uniref:ABC transporter substrate-binding protein n=1 Tax=Cumulibacter manganitolerans TaxID=1884992 RepID=UPI001296242A|nr:ABC transporter substrate-binding protein [Cumulibacter manganitolerans]